MNEAERFAELCMKASYVTGQVLAGWVVSPGTFAEVLRQYPYHVQIVVTKELESLGVLRWENSIPQLEW